MFCTQSFVIFVGDSPTSDTWLPWCEESKYAIKTGTESSF